MNPLLVGLLAVDEMNGGQEMKRLVEGWTGREPNVGRLRSRFARTLLAVAARLAPPMGSPRLHDVPAMPLR